MWNTIQASEQTVDALNVSMKRLCLRCLNKLKNFFFCGKETEFFDEETQALLDESTDDDFNIMNDLDYVPGFSSKLLSNYDIQMLTEKKNNNKDCSNELRNQYWYEVDSNSPTVSKTSNQKSVDQPIFLTEEDTRLDSNKNEEFIEVKDSVGCKPMVNENILKTSILKNKIEKNETCHEITLKDKRIDDFVEDNSSRQNEFYPRSNNKSNNEVEIDKRNTKERINEQKEKSDGLSVDEEFDLWNNTEQSKLWEKNKDKKLFSKKKKVTFSLGMDNHRSTNEDKESLSKLDESDFTNER